MLQRFTVNKGLLQILILFSSSSILPTFPWWCTWSSAASSPLRAQGCPTEPRKNKAHPKGTALAQTPLLLSLERHQGRCLLQCLHDLHVNPANPDPAHAVCSWWCSTSPALPSLPPLGCKNPSSGAHSKPGALLRGTLCSAFWKS